MMNYRIDFIKPFGIKIEATAELSNILNLETKELQILFRQHQLILLRGFTPFKNTDDFIKFCELWGEISIWPFGKVLELIEHDNPSDHIFDNNYVPMHWDGMYRPQVPEYQIFQCVNAPMSNQGGRTTFSNTKLLLENASAEEKLVWEKVTGSYQRKMEFYCSKTVSPIITKHPHLDYEVIRYNEPPSDDQGQFVNPPELEFLGIDEKDLNNLHRSLKSALYNTSNFYAHDWQAGDIVIADNFTLLHGREKFVSGAPRHLQRVHVLSDPPYNNPALRSYE